MAPKITYDAKAQRNHARKRFVEYARTLTNVPEPDVKDGVTELQYGAILGLVILSAILTGLAF